jgi:hypothetical protein
MKRIRVRDRDKVLEDLGETASGVDASYSQANYCRFHLGCNHRNLSRDGFGIVPAK